MPNASSRGEKPADLPAMQGTKSTQISMIFEWRDDSRLPLQVKTGREFRHPVQKKYCAAANDAIKFKMRHTRFSVRVTHTSLSSTGSTGRSSRRRPRVLDCPSNRAMTPVGQRNPGP
jgi:hypothetical protein